MKLRGGVRHMLFAAVMWLSLALAIGSTLIAAVSGRWHFFRYTARLNVSVWTGEVFIEWNPLRAQTAWIWNEWNVYSVEPDDRGESSWTWLPRAGIHGGGGAGWWYVAVPLWIVAAPSAVTFGTLAWARRRRRRRSDMCRRCRYDLDGLAADTACPECGLTRPRASATPRTR